MLGHDCPVVPRVAHRLELAGPTTFETQEFVGGPDGRVREVRFQDGSAVKAELVVVAVGLVAGVQVKNGPS